MKQRYCIFFFTGKRLHCHSLTPFGQTRYIFFPLIYFFSALTHSFSSVAVYFFFPTYFFFPELWTILCQYHFLCKKIRLVIKMFRPEKTQNIIKSKKYGLKYLHHLLAPPLPKVIKKFNIGKKYKTKRFLKLLTKIIIKRRKLIKKRSKF